MKSKLKTIVKLSIAIIIVSATVLFLLYTYNKTGTIIPTAELFDGKPTFRFLDVGQGDCMLVTFEGKSVLVDAGPTSYGAAAAEYLRLYSPSIDYFIITHPHEDHMGGASDIMELVDVEYLVLSDEVVNDNFYRKAIETAEKKGVNIVYLNGAASYTTGSITIEIADNSELLYDNLNDASFFVKITAAGTSCLITGDAESAAEEYALENYGTAYLDCDIFKVAHHGSSTSNSEEFLSAVSPDICVISCGRNNSYGHPSNDVTERIENIGAVLYRTDYEGNLVIRGKK